MKKVCHLSLAILLGCSASQIYAADSLPKQALLARQAPDSALAPFYFSSASQKSSAENQELKDSDTSNHNSSHSDARLIKPLVTPLNSVKANASNASLNSNFTPAHRLTPALPQGMSNSYYLNAINIDAEDVWSRIRSGFAMQELKNPLVLKQAKAFSIRPEQFEALTNKASPYLYHLVQSLEDRGMPTELALLPFIESSFNPLAVSKANAAGMWQFMPATGKAYNLNKTAFYDNRLNVVASTDAALTYLQYLHESFGDWQLALAAYNWGEGSLRKLIKKNQKLGRGISFNELSKSMPAETQAYVPKLMAFKKIIDQPEKYQVSLKPIANEPYFTNIDATKDLDVTVAAQLAEISLNEFKALNPQFNKPLIPSSETDKIILPQANADKFKTNLSQWTHALSSWTSHTVGATYEKIESIAARFKTSPALLRQVNNIPPRMNIRAGSTLLVPKVESQMLVADLPSDIVNAASLSMTPEPAKISSNRYMKAPKAGIKKASSTTKNKNMKRRKAY